MLMTHPVMLSAFAASRAPLLNRTSGSPVGSRRISMSSHATSSEKPVPSALSTFELRVPGFSEFGQNRRPSRRMAMQKKYVVRLTKQERQILRDVIRGLKGSS